MSWRRAGRSTTSSTSQATCLLDPPLLVSLLCLSVLSVMLCSYLHCLYLPPSSSAFPAIYLSRRECQGLLSLCDVLDVCSD